MTTVIETPEGPVPIPIAIPHGASTQLHIPHVDTGYSWGDVKLWWDDGVTGAWNGIKSVFGFAEDAASYPITAIENMIVAAGYQTQTWVSSMINLAVDYTATVDIALHDITDALETYTIDTFQYVFDQLNSLEALLGALGIDVEQRIFDAVQGIEAGVRDLIAEAIHNVEQWVLSDVFQPLEQEIVRYYDNVIDRIGALEGTIADEIAHAVNVETLERIAAIAGLATIVAAIASEIADCVEPMCEQFGPGTDLNKALQALKGLLTLLAGVEIANLTLDELETLAGTLTRVAGTDFADFFDAFVTGGETIGAAGSTILGDLTEGGADVLRAIGVPVP